MEKMNNAARRRKWDVDSHKAHMISADFAPRNPQPNAVKMRVLPAKTPVFHTSGYGYGSSLIENKSEDLTPTAVVRKCAAIAKRKGLPCTITPEEVRREP